MLVVALATLVACAPPATAPTATPGSTGSQSPTSAPRTTAPTPTPTPTPSPRLGPAVQENVQLIASGLEAQALKAEFKDRLLVVTPGIRPVENRSDDQKRTVDVAQAFANGADYIVVGRPIHQAPDPRAAALGIQATIAAAFSA